MTTETLETGPPPAVSDLEPPQWMLDHWAEIDRLQDSGDLPWPTPPIGDDPATHEQLLNALDSDAHVMELGRLLDGQEADAGDAERIDRIRGWARVVAHAQARMMREVARMHENRDADPTYTDADEVAYLEFLSVEVGLALRLSSGQGSRLVEDSWELAEHLPATWKALSEGRIDLTTARAIIGGTALLSPEARAEVEEACLDKAKTPNGTAAAIRHFARRQALKADPEAAAKRAEAAARDIGVSKAGEVVDGVGDLTVTLSARDRAAVWTALNDHARALKELPGETRSLHALRGAVLVDLLTRPWALDRENQTVTSPRWKVDVVVNLTTLLGLDEDPAVLVGHGPVSAEVARELAADGVWRRLLTDPAGGVVERSTRRYRPTTALADHVEARDQHCQTPGCRRPAADCEKDHRVPYEAGGSTCACNLWLLCKHHHRCKHSPGWTFRREPDGTVQVTTPTGHTYTAPASTPWD